MPGRKIGFFLVKLYFFMTTSNILYAGLRLVGPKRDRGRDFLEGSDLVEDAGVVWQWISKGFYEAVKGKV